MDIVAKYKNLSIEFKKESKSLKAVSNVSFDIYKGEVLAIVGESGCGKTLTAMSMLGLTKNNKSTIVEGNIYVNGQDVFNISEKQLREIRGKDIAVIYQDPMTSLNPVLTIGNQLIEGGVIHLNINKKQAKERGLGLLNQVGIEDYTRVYKSYPHELSGGLRQRVIIAMALMCSPKLLIADEPTTALDVSIQAQILELLKKIKEENNMSILIISHDLGVVSSMADRIMVMYGGKVIEQGSKSQVLNNPKHPYTKALIKSNLCFSENTKRLYSIKGSPISGYDLPNYCYFYERCEEACVNCKETSSELIEVEKDHLVACIKCRKV